MNEIASSYHLMTDYTFVVTCLSRKEWIITTRANSLAEAEASVLLKTRMEGPPRGAAQTTLDYDVTQTDRIPSHLF